ncbi:T6SS effector phospholipase Tle3 domain-containing protein [Burkholderia stagnalis]
MADQFNRPDDADTLKPYRHDTATRIVPMQRDHLGQPYWESYHTPSSFQVRAECRIPPHMPGAIIFVHGVNSTGEWYDAAEQALCEGLNERLNLSDGLKLRENRYITYDKNTDKPIVRQLDPEWSGHSPVIRFYWGYSAAPGTELNWRIPMRNPRGFDIWSPQCTNEKGPWYWGGGPFQNGTNNLPQLWSSEGFKRHVLRFDMESLNTEADRQLQDSPPRTYYAHAAQRLANLIDRIRDECPRDTVTVMSHSQGTMIALAATALCKTRAPDAVFVMNSPYALDDKVTDALTCGAERPTPEARINTFRNIANRIKQDKHVFTETELKQLQCGASEDMDFWRPDNRRKSGVHERDNHGRLYVYFTPHDRVMGATPLQSIGWQGVDDKLLAELGDTVKQRMLARGTPVGDAPGMKKFGTLPLILEDKLVPGAKSTDFWNGNRNIFTPLVTLWAVPHPDKTVMVNAEQVPNPVTADEMRQFENSRKGVDEMGAWIPDPNDPNTGSYADPDYRYMRSTFRPGRKVVTEDVYSSRRTTRPETQDEMLQRLDAYLAEPTNHSTLPQHQAFMRRVVAYDLPIGFCDAYERPAFWTRLTKFADWMQGYDDYFELGVPQSVVKPTRIDWGTVAEEQTKTEIEQLRQQQWKGGA